MILAMKESAKGLRLIFTIALAVLNVQAQSTTEVIRLDPALDNIVPVGAHVEQLADDFGFPEGPVWVRKGGYLLFSDIPANVIDKWTPDGKISVFLKPSGYTGTNPSEDGREVDNRFTSATPNTASTSPAW